MTVDLEVRSAAREADGVDTAFRNDVLIGLSTPQKAIPARWFYDQRGSRLFEDITRLPEYYPTRSEVEILEAKGGEIARLTGQGRAVVEFGSGSSAKSPLLLDAIAPAAYVPIDISGDFLRASAQALAGRFPGLPVVPVEADFTRKVSLPLQVADLPMLGFFPGSTIGNLAPMAAVDLLRSMRETLGDEAQLLIGLDRIKDEQTLIAAYDDAQGVTAAFNLNLLHRINRELGANIPVDAFRHAAIWNARRSRIEMHLVASRDVSFDIGGRAYVVRGGETIHTENSHKYDPAGAVTLLAAGGWMQRAVWSDSENRFLLVLADADIRTAAP